MRYYVKPTIEVVKLETPAILSDSVNFNATKVNASDAEARRGTLGWDDEE